MKVFKNIPQLRAALQHLRHSNQSIGLVPTMGALHEGHLSIVKQAQEKCDIVVVSIFVNPTQFNNAEDLEKYPRNETKDLQKLEVAGCDIVFLPQVEEIYPFPHDLAIHFGNIETQLEGKFRPGHFKGVGLVVSKLFNIVQPDSAFFGQKDLQQFYVIHKLVQQLSFPISLHKVDTQREANGLAMSSRNERLTLEERAEAAIIYQSLQQAADSLAVGKSVAETILRAKELFAQSDRFRLEYFEIVETDNFCSITNVTHPKKTAICIAAEVGKVRLIDNLILNY